MKISLSEFKHRFYFLSCGQFDKDTRMPDEGDEIKMIETAQIIVNEQLNHLKSAMQVFPSQEDRDKNILEEWKDGGGI